MCLSKVAINAQGGPSGYPGPVPGGETHVSEIKPNVEEARKLVVQELQNQAKTLPESPSVEITDFDATEQVCVFALIVVASKFYNEYVYCFVAVGSYINAYRPNKQYSILKFVHI